MTDHKPLSEGEIETVREARELLKAYVCDVEDGIEEEQTEARLVIAKLYALLGEPIPHDYWRTKPKLVASPKPLDGETERLCTELRDEAQRVREIIADHWQINPDVLDRAADAIERALTSRISDAPIVPLDVLVDRLAKRGLRIVKETDSP